ncbi:hypothetical protein YQE_10060, partial [Dendroctonus ponderosae]
MANGPIAERNRDATIYVGGLDDKVSESLLWELFVQAGPLVNVHMPKDRVTMMHQGYGFVEFMGEEDADYAIKIMNMIKLYGKPIRVNKASAHQKNLDVGANIFIGNLDPEVDEKLLYDTFSAFGVILQTPKIMRDPETGNSKGFAFINFASFEASDASIEAMNGQYLCNRSISVSYAFKKDSKGERHGSAAERNDGDDDGSAATASYSKRNDAAATTHSREYGTAPATSSASPEFIPLRHSSASVAAVATSATAWGSAAAPIGGQCVWIPTPHASNASQFRLRSDGAKDNAAPSVANRPRHAATSTRASWVCSQCQLSWDVPAAAPSWRKASTA